jgi:hypothetical protein
MPRSQRVRGWRRHIPYARLIEYAPDCRHDIAAVKEACGYGSGLINNLMPVASAIMAVVTGIKGILG